MATPSPQSPNQQPPNAWVPRLLVPTTSGPIPTSFRRFISQAELTAAVGFQVQVQLQNAMFISVYNRTANAIWLEIQPNSGNSLELLVERGATRHITLPFPAVGLVVTDLRQARGYRFGFDREDVAIGRRRAGELPYISTVSLTSGTSGPSGGVLVAASSQPAVVSEDAAGILPAINYQQQALAISAGSITLSSSTPTVGGSAPFFLAAGYFVGFHVFNPSASGGNLTVVPNDAFNDFPPGPTINYPPGFSAYVPVEADTLDITATAAGQMVLAYQSVLYARSE